MRRSASSENATGRSCGQLQEGTSLETEGITLRHVAVRRMSDDIRVINPRSRRAGITAFLSRQHSFDCSIDAIRRPGTATSPVQVRRESLQCCGAARIRGKIRSAAYPRGDAATIGQRAVCRSGGRRPSSTSPRPSSSPSACARSSGGRRRRRALKADTACCF